jgi:hypothetical protein
LFQRIVTDLRERTGLPHLCVHPIICALPGNFARNLTESSSSTGISVCGCVEVIQNETRIFPHQNITSLEILCRVHGEHTERKQAETRICCHINTFININILHFLTSYSFLTSYIFNQ